MKIVGLFLLIIIPLGSFTQNVPSDKNKISKNSIIKSSKSDPVDSLINVCISEINHDSIKSSMKHLQDFETRYLLSPNRKNIALWLQNRFISFGYPNCMIDSFKMVTNMPNGPVNDTSIQYNVVTTLEGNVNPDNVYIVGGHYDAITNINPMVTAPGADDDASGVAATLEIARVMKKTGYTPESTIKFISFAGEEAMISYCDTSGSQHYVANAVKNNENIQFFISNDMISNSSSTSNWSIEIRNHDPQSDIVNLADFICLNYTTVAPINVFQAQYGADEYPFFMAGYPAIFLQEAEYSPNWHKESDTLGNCNIAYCAEVCKISAGMLIHGSETPLKTKQLFIVNPGNGHTLIPSWEPNTETNLAGYKVYLGTKSNIYDTVFLTTDTSFVFNNLLTDTLYYIGVSAFNNKGVESAISEKSDAPAVVTLSNGILIIRDSKSGISSPTEQETDDFYNQIFDGFIHSQYDATITNKMSLGLIGKYSSIIWYVNNKSWAGSILSKFTDILRNYVNLGGHILFSLYKPSKFLGNNTTNRSFFKKGSFIYDYANIAKSNDTNTSRFSSVYTISSIQDSMHVDSVKITPSLFNHLPYIEAMSPTINGQSFLLFDSEYDSTSPQGCFNNRPVGIENKSLEKNVITLSFPLYYMKFDQAKAFIYHTMVDKFHESYSGIKKNVKNELIEIFAYPNPTEGKITIGFSQQEAQQLQIINTFGNVVYESNKPIKNSTVVDLSYFPKGVYLIRIKINNANFAKKFVLQ